jgi:DEAD/DEAH box helicase domain-containing protein
MGAVVLDLETEKNFQEVGGKHNLKLLGVTVVGVYDYASSAFSAFEKEEFDNLERMLENSQLLIGFNIKHFDLPVLEPHVKINLGLLTVLDLMSDVEKNLGFRVSLDNLSRATLGVGKIGMGLEAIDWWREGKKDKVKEYCIQDVRLTRDLYEFGKREGFVLADTRDRGRVRIQVGWRENKQSNRQILEAALAKRVAVEILYVLDGTNKAPLRYKIDIHVISRDGFEGFCHLRRMRRSFQLDHVESIMLTNEPYQLQNDVQRSLI